MILILFLITTHTINTFSQDNILLFADHLYEQKDYTAALNEYYRYKFLVDSIPENILEKIIHCLVHLGKFEQALSECQQLQDKDQQIFIQGNIFFYAGEYDSARCYLNKVKSLDKKSIARTIGLSYAAEFRFTEAGQYLDLPPKKPKYKKCALAALYALIPGAGHLYCAKTGDAVFSFFMITGSALISYYYYHREEDLKFGLALSITGLFYAANVYGAINAAQNYNYYENEKYLTEILENNK